MRENSTKAVFRRWRIGIAAGLLALAILVMACGLAGVAVQRRAIRPPEFSARIGMLHFVTLVVDSPACQQPIRVGLPHPMCSSGSLFTDAEYYSAWLIVRYERPNGGRQINYRRLFIMRLDS